MNKPMPADNQPPSQADRSKARDVPNRDVAEREVVNRDGRGRAAARKPTGPVIYTIQKGADVWPGRK